MLTSPQVYCRIAIEVTETAVFKKEFSPSIVKRIVKFKHCEMSTGGMESGTVSTYVITAGNLEIPFYFKTYSLSVKLSQ